MKSLAALVVLLSFTGCNSQPPQPSATADESASASPRSDFPDKIPSYEELLGPRLAEKMKNGGPWSFDDLEPMSKALAELKKLSAALAHSGNDQLIAQAKQRHSELSATYITLKQVAISAGQRKAPVLVPQSANSASEDPSKSTEKSSTASQ
ncbi:MAG: hypothetical protein MUC50_07345 [Myxococcota bacterium]|jgi:hypothetical protein|nr:hypothetical protein [Myxococcota bacterium]